MKIGIIGNGFVGKATSLLECDKNKIFIYDKNPNLCKNTKDIVDLKYCDIIFVSVPTPMNPNGSCHIDILQKVIEELEIEIVKRKDIIVSRCTCPIGTSDKMGVSYMPEFLTEKNFGEDFHNTNPWVLGTESIILKNKIETIIKNAFEYGKIKYQEINIMTTKEAEAVKLFRNTFLATKIAFCNEFHEFCERININYDEIRKIATKDGRIGDSHSFVPGPDGKMGFGGVCLPKDINSLIYQMKNVNMESFILKNVVKRNNIVDRPEKDYLSEKGRSIIDDKEEYNVTIDDMIKYESREIDNKMCTD